MGTTGKKGIGTALVLLAGSLWGMIGIFVRRLNEWGLESMEVVTVRAVLTTVLLVLAFLLFKRELLKIKLKHIWCFIGTGFGSIIFFNFCYFKTVTMTSLSVAAVLLYTAPAMVMVMSLFLFHEKLTRKKIVALLCSFIGCMLVTGIIGSSVTLSVTSILFGLGSGFGYALYTIFSRYALERGYHPLTITVYTFIVATVGLIPFVSWKEIAVTVTADSRHVVVCLLFAIVSTVIPYFTYTVGLTYVESSKASIMASIEPVVATFIGIVYFKEKPNAVGLLGVVLVLGSIAILAGKHQEEIKIEGKE